MKKHTYIPEILIFCLILFGCIIPPFLITSSSLSENNFSNWTFPWQSLCHAIFAAVLFVISKKIINAPSSDSKNQVESKKVYFLLYFIIPMTLTFGSLFSISLILKFFSIIFNEKTEILVEKPDSFLAALFCIINFACAAFYEEVIYRFYFPQTLIRFFKLKSNRKILEVIAEIIGALVFAFAHLYLGYISVINAFAAHIVLRLCYKKCNNIWAGYFAHFIYNIISLILL